MTDTPAKPEKGGSKISTGKAALAGAAIGSAALAAALLYASSRRKAAKPTSPPEHPENATETD